MRSSASRTSPSPRKSTSRSWGRKRRWRWGLRDEFRKAKLRIFGPTKAAARLESSKSFSKELLANRNILTARARSFDRIEPALAYLDEHPVPVVVKADGLAQGKGVVVATTRNEARQAVRDMMEKATFGQAGRQVLIEEFLDGEELTVMAFTDGSTVVPIIPTQDHERVGDGDGRTQYRGNGPTHQRRSVLLNCGRR